MTRGMESDHGNDWSEEMAPPLGFGPPEPTGEPRAEAAPSARGPAGLADRALQTLREAGLSLCPGTGSRTQVLPLGQSLRRAAAHGVRPDCEVRRGLAMGGEPPQSTRTPGGDLRDQPGIAPASRGTGVEAHGADDRDRPRGGRDSRRQHASIVFRCGAPQSTRERRGFWGPAFERSGNPGRVAR
jgi:hypothetical protein